MCLCLVLHQLIKTLADCSHTAVMCNCDCDWILKKGTFFHLKCTFNVIIPPNVESTHCFEYFTVNSKNTTTQMINTSLYLMLPNCNLHVFHREGGVNMVRSSNNSKIKDVNVQKNAEKPS